MSNTKATIGPRGTVPGFRPLIGSEQWHRDNFTPDMLQGGWRPLLLDERYELDDQWKMTFGWVKVSAETDKKCWSAASFSRTRRPLPPPPAETFEAHGHIWYKHTPGDPCPVEPSVVVEVLYRSELTGQYRSIEDAAKDWVWDDDAPHNDLIGYRFPDFPATQVTTEATVEVATQAIPSTGSESNASSDSKGGDCTHKRLKRMYDGWFDDMPESVEECVADVKRVLYPTDAERCEAAFQKWCSSVAEQGMEPSQHKAAWKAAWQAAKEDKL